MRFLYRNLPVLMFFMFAMAAVLESCGMAREVTVTSIFWATIAVGIAKMAISIFDSKPRR